MSYHAITQKRYYENHKEKRKAASNQYNAVHKKERKIYNKKYIEHIRKETIASLGGCCLICKTTEDLCIHHVNGHINGTRKGGRTKNMYSDWKNNRHNLALLCRQHHDEYHNFCGVNINHDTILDYILGKFIDNEDWY